MQSILNQFSLTPYVAAVATNAIRINSFGVPLKIHLLVNNMFLPSSKTIVFRERYKFVQQYLAGDLGGCANFSSYAYNADLIKGILPELSRCRYYFDTIFLSRILDRGPIVWINEPLVKLRCHQATISASCGIRDYKSFISTTSKSLGIKSISLY